MAGNDDGPRFRKLPQQQQQQQRSTIIITDEAIHESNTPTTATSSSSSSSSRSVSSNSTRQAKRQCCCCRCANFIGSLMVAILWHFNGFLRQLLLAGITMLIFTVASVLIGAVMFTVASNATTMLWKYTFGMVFHSNLFDINTFNADATEPGVFVHHVQTFYMFSAVGMAIGTLLMIIVLLLMQVALCCTRTRSGYAESRLENLLRSTKQRPLIERVRQTRR